MERDDATIVTLLLEKGGAPVDAVKTPQVCGAEEQRAHDARAARTRYRRPLRTALTTAAMYGHINAVAILWAITREMGLPLPTSIAR